MIFRKLKKIFSGEVEWNKPKQREIIIYGEYNAELILPYTNPAQIIVLSHRTVNMYVAVRCLLKGRLSLMTYFVEYIKLARAGIVITALDNDLLFWSFKEFLPGIKTILLQYAWRGELADVFGTLKRDTRGKKYSIDYMFHFNENFKKKYLEYIDGESIIAGSFKNNSIAVLPRTSKNTTVTFISQYRPEQIYHPVFFFEGDEPYYRDDFYETERALLPLLSRYCKANMISLQICAHGNTSEEYHYFGDMIGNYDWDFIPRIQSFDSYKTVQRSAIVVGIDSTLIYEAFGRGIRTGFFNKRSVSLRNQSYTFGWPGNFGQCGPIWSEIVDEQEVHRVLDFLIAADDAEWSQLHKRYAPEIMEFDEGNTKFVDLLKKLGARPAGN